jgi:hypothetical protein
VSVPQKDGLPEPTGATRIALFVRRAAALGVFLVWPALWFESRTIALATVGALAVQFTADLVAGIAHYREVMARPWPEVQPIDDDDW